MLDLVFPSIRDVDDDGVRPAKQDAPEALRRLVVEEVLRRLVVEEALPP